MTTEQHFYRAMRFLTFFLMIGLAGCAGGIGGSDTDSASSDAPAFSAESDGQKLLLEGPQERDAMMKKSQQSDVAAPESAAKKPCDDYPGFDRGCPGGGK